MRITGLFCGRVGRSPHRHGERPRDHSQTQQAETQPHDGVADRIEHRHFPRNADQKEEPQYVRQGLDFRGFLSRVRFLFWSMPGFFSYAG